MADTTNTAEIQVVVDASGVEAGLRQATTSAERAERAMSGGAANSARAQSNLISAIQRTSAQMEAGSRTSARYWEITARQRGVDPAVLEPYLRQLRRVEEAQRQAANSAESAGDTIKRALGSALAGLSIAALGQQIISAQREFDKLNASLVTATGSTDRAAQAFAALQAFAATTPYGVAEATEAFIKMRNLGLDPSERALRSYGNTAAAMGKSLEQMVEAVADASTGEFERLKEFGIKASQQGEKVTLTFKGASTTIKNDAEAIEGYLMKLGEVDFAGAMVQRAATLDGAISQLSDTWESTMRTISNSGIGKAAQDGVLGLSAALGDLQTILVAIKDAADKQASSMNGVEIVHKSLTTVFESVSVLGVNVAYVLTQVGKELGGLAAQAKAVATGEFAQARIIGEMMKAEAERDRKEVDAKTAAILGAVEKAKKAAEGAPKKPAGEDALAQFRVQREAERESAEAAKRREKAAREAAEALKKEAGLIAELAGYNADFAEKRERLNDAYAKGAITFAELGAAQAKLLAQQPAAKQAMSEQLKGQAESDKLYEQGIKTAEQYRDSLLEQVSAQRDSNEQIGLTGPALAELIALRLESTAAQKEESAASIESLDPGSQMAEMYREQAAALRDLAIAKRDGAARQASVDSAKQAADDWKRASDEIERSLTDALLRGFESGKSFGRNLVDTLKNMFSTLVLRPVIQGVVQSGMSMGSSVLGMSGAAGNAAGGASSMLSSISSAGSLYGAYQGSALGQFMSGMSGSAGYAAHYGIAPMTGAARLGNATASGLGAGGSTPWLGMAGGGLAAYQVGEKYGPIAGGLAGAGTIAAGGALTGALAGTGAMAGATAALAAVPVWGWVAIAALSVLGGMQKGPEKNTRLTFGSNNAAGNISINERGNEGKLGQSYIDGSSSGAFGSFGVVSSFWMNAAQPAVQEFIKSVTATDNALAQFMDATEKASVTTALSAQRTVSNSGPEGSDPNGLGGLDKVFTERIKTIFSTLEPGLDAVLTGFKGNSQQLGAEAEALLQYRTALAQSGETLFGAKVTLQQLAALAQPTEAVSVAIGRITSQFELTNAVAASLGKTAAEAFGAAGLASLGAREKFVSAAGGFYALAANAEGFARDFLTEAERNAPVLKMVTAQMQALGFASVDTREEFKQIVMGLDLTKDEGVKTYAELMHVAAAFAQVYPVIDNTAAAAKELADAQARANEVQQERIGLQDRLDSLLMTTDQLREKEIAKLDASNQAILRQIFATEDYRAALEAETVARNNATQAAKDRGAGLLSSVDGMFSALQSVVNREKALLQESANAHRSLSSALHGALDSMNVSGRELEDRQAARAQIQTALAIAKASGVLPSADSLKGALSVLGKDASSMFATQQDYLRDFYSTQNDIAALAGITDDALSVEEKSLKALDDIVSNAQQQVEALKGIDTSVLSLVEAMRGFSVAIGAAKADPVASAGGGIAGLYKELLGRSVDSAGMSFWQDQMAAGVSLSAIRDAIMGGDEYKKLRGFAVGTNFVPTDMPAMIHEGERIIPAADNRELMRRLSSPSDNSAALATELRALREENAGMRRDLNAALYAIAKHTMETKDALDKWDVTGLPAEREA